ncbi:hypothetical protein GCM10023340_15170 [Nocardioides marinquilinus]|uniref:ThuA-like domain-containing protein n=1 Tax=Nocardioides marinquilinus TaxID=1210400 RepID=A0ABP9PG14_9ACTN
MIDRGSAAVALATAAAAACLSSAAPGAALPEPSPDAGRTTGPARVVVERAPRFDVLVFSRTAGFRHESIDEGRAAIRELGRRHGFSVTTTESPRAFTDANLRRFEAVVWLSTTGDVLARPQQRAFQRYVRAGGGYVGVHAAADTEHDWPWYGRLVGAWFRNHPAIQRATVRVENRRTPSSCFLPRAWSRTDEWYNFRAPRPGSRADVSPRGRVTVIARLDESTYDEHDGTARPDDHPIAWQHRFEGGRAWYTGGGHTEESYAEPRFRRHLLGGIRWAVQQVDGAACA